MRSSVSVMLQTPAPDTSMSYPDYAAHPNQHHALLLLVKQVGNQIKNRSFHKLFERINRVTHVNVPDSSGQQRPVWVTYKKDYPVDNNDWGEFQTHRRVLGIISIGQVGSQADLNAVCNEHESLKVKYSSTIFDSRCIILGLNPDGSVYQSPDCHVNTDIYLDGSPSSVSPPASPPLKSSASDRDSGVYETADRLNGDARVNGTGSDSGSESTSDLAGEEESQGTSNSDFECTKASLIPPSSFKTRTLFYPTGEHAVNIESQIQEFIGYLFWVLEYKRMDKAKERNEKPQLLCAPFERKDFVGLDMESRTNRKRSSGRLKKHLADLSLQAGLVSEALSLYSQAADTLKSCNDWLWFAASYEGLCSASALTLYPEIYKRNLLQRYSSLGGTVDISNDKSKSATNSLPPGISPSAKLNAKYCLSADDIVDRYKEAIVHYSKYRNAGVIETEASIKAVHVLIEQKRYLMAAEFLSNVVFINLQLTDEEKIVRFNTLAEMYSQIGFHRKAAFFRRVAAMRCVAPQNPTPDWSQCYRLLLQALPGYKLSLDLVNFMQEGRPGWPTLQIQLLHELKGTSQRMGQDGLCTRHQAFLLSAMLPHLSITDRSTNVALLELVGDKSPSGVSPMVVPETGTLVPAINFYNIPLCRSVGIMNPPKERKVEQRTESCIDSSPFIFTPFSSLSVAAKPPGQVDCLWVDGDVCEVSLVFENPMSVPLKLTSMMLITEGSEFESWTSTVVISPPRASVTLRGRPREPGDLKIVGYSFTLCAVTSHCRFKFMPQLRVPHYALTVVPSLPCVQLLCSSSNKSSNSEGLLALKLLAGDRRSFSIVIHNTSNSAVEEIDLSLDCPLDKIFEYSVENLRSQLPIGAGGKAILTLYIYALTDFLFEEDISEPQSMMSSQSMSLFSRQSNTVSSFVRRSFTRPQSVSSMASSHSGSSRSSFSGHQSLHSAPQSSLQMQTPSYTHHSSRSIEATLKLGYTGGKGKALDYWRTATLPIKLDISPSLMVTRWDAIPAEMPNQFYVVLDLFNASAFEMNLQYTLGKNILIQAGESCRVPVPVERCPMSKLQKLELSDVEVSEASRTLGEHVASFIDLQWQLSPTESPEGPPGDNPSEGPSKAVLSTLPFPPQTHHLITMPPIHWKLKLNGESVCAGAEVCGQSGQPQLFTVCVQNSSGDRLPPVMLKLIPFQDFQNGLNQYHLETKVSTIGSNKLVINELNPEESHSHECGLVFFYPGVYKVELSCIPLYSKVADTAKTDTVSVVSSLNQNTATQDYQIWKLAPPIEITIEDSVTEA